MRKSALVFAALLFAGVRFVSAAPVTLTFTGLQNLEPINNYYNGGTGGFGSSGGTNYGISFTSDSLAIISSENGGTGNTSNVPAPGTDTIAFFLSGAGDTMDVAAGFTTGFSFYYAAPNHTGSVQVFSGLNGTGTLLATDNLALTAGSCDPVELYSCWVNTGVGFSGAAESVIFTGTANYIGFADITTGSILVPTPTPTPEPNSLILATSGLLGIAGLLRRKICR